MTASRPNILLVGSGHQLFREYLMREAAQYADLWLIEASEPTWQWPYLTGHTAIDTFDAAAAVAAVRLLAAEQVFAGVFCYHEGMIATAATVARFLGLPGPTPEAIAACRDKATTRQLLAVAGVPQPRFELVGGDSVSPDLLQEFGTPLVVKPRALGASQGVIRINTPDQLAGGLEVARSASQPGMTNFREVLVEEYVEGEEVSIDGFFDGLEYSPLFLARKRLGPQPYFEEMGHTVEATDSLLADEALLALLTAAHRALGVRDAITHTEVRLTTTGPMLIEVNGRLGGDLIPLLATRATNVEPARCGIGLAIGERPAPPTYAGKCSGIRFLQPDRSCVVKSVSIDVAAAAALGVQFQQLAGEGTQLRLPPDGYASRYAMLIADGEDAADCNRKLDAASEIVRLEWHDLD